MVFLKRSAFAVGIVVLALAGCAPSNPAIRLNSLQIDEARQIPDDAARVYLQGFLPSGWLQAPYVGKDQSIAFGDIKKVEFVSQGRHLLNADFYKMQLGTVIRIHAGNATTKGGEIEFGTKTDLSQESQLKIMQALIALGAPLK